MKNIITRKNFLNETNLSGVKLYSEVCKYITYYMQDELDEKDTYSFRSSYYFKKNYKSHIENLDKFLKKKLGYSLDQFMRDFKKEIYNDDFFTTRCGFLDTLLYTYDQKYILSGSILEDYGAGDEFVIKYNYGYNNFELGKKYLLQNYNSLEDFYFYCAQKFVVTYIEESTKYLNTRNDRINDIDKTCHLFSLADKRKSGSVCVIDLNKFQEIYKDKDNHYFKSALSLSNIITIEFREIKKRFENIYGANELNYKYVKEFFSDFDMKAMIIGFGDINLNDIPDTDIYEYIEQIEINNSANKYNL